MLFCGFFALLDQKVRKIVAHSQYTGDKIDIKMLDPGLYILKLSDEKNRSIVRKIVKK